MELVKTNFELSWIFSDEVITVQSQKNVVKKMIGIMFIFYLELPHIYMRIIV